MLFKKWIIAFILPLIVVQIAVLQLLFAQLKPTSKKYFSCDEIKKWVPDNQNLNTFSEEKLDKQLNDAMCSFILLETTIDMHNKTITASKLLHWYRGDFGGTKRIKTMLSKILGID